MPRPLKCRRVASVPGTTFFKPAGIPVRLLEEVELSLEEAEALRLKEIEGLDQEAAAEKMNISRPTFQRVLASARRKVADALLNGKAIRITGGNVEMAFRRFRCHRGHEWNTPYEAASRVEPALCPTCNMPGIASSHAVPVEIVGRSHDRGGPHGPRVLGQ
jgi:predicted DNA-binding protein (UPF0251 family)